MTSHITKAWVNGELVYDMNSEGITMEQIDWSKAPEGATHWEPEGGSRAGWMKLENNIWYFWPVGKWDKYEWNETTVSDKRASTMCARPSTPSWSSEGLPPVGVVCEMQDDIGNWLPVEIIAVHAGYAHGWYEKSELCFYSNLPCEFRPIRTTEQIATDEREAAIKQMIEDGDGRGLYVCLEDVLGRLHDKGYRKP